MKFNQVNNWEGLWPNDVSGFWDTCASVRFHMLGVMELMYQCSGKNEHCVWGV